MATALALRSGLDPGRIVRTLGEEYTGKLRNVKETLDAVKYVVSMSDYMHIERMLTSGCPYELSFEESTESRLKIIGRGNQTSFVQHSEQVAKSVNKEERNGHIFLCTSGCATWELTCVTQLRAW